MDEIRELILAPSQVENLIGDTEIKLRPQMDTLQCGAKHNLTSKMESKENLPIQTRY